MTKEPRLDIEKIAKAVSLRSLIDGFEEYRNTALLVFKHPWRYAGLYIKPDPNYSLAKSLLLGLYGSEPIAAWQACTRSETWRSWEEEWFHGWLRADRQALAIEEQLGDRSGMATSYHNLGMVAYLRGELKAPLEWYHRSLAIKEQLGDRAGMANSYHQRHGGPAAR